MGLYTVGGEGAYTRVVCVHRNLRGLILGGLYTGGGLFSELYVPIYSPVPPRLLDNKYDPLSLRHQQVRGV